MSQASGQNNSSGPGSHLPGIFQSLIAAALGGGVTPSVKAIWLNVMHWQLPDWAQSPLSNLVAAAVFIPVCWLVTRPLKTRFFQRSPKPVKNRLSVYVAEFGEEAEMREAVMRTIEREIGLERVEVLPAALLLAADSNISLDLAPATANKKAREFLSRHGGDLMIWGRRINPNGMDTRIEIFFVSAEHEQKGTDSFALTPSITLDERFSPEMGTALAAVAASAASGANIDTSHYCTATLRPLAQRLQPIAQNLPVALKAEDRARILESYGTILRTIGLQAGENPALAQAIQAFQHALFLTSQASNPEPWASIQYWLGNALSDLGALESGTDKLEQSVAAFREALKERRRERVPLAWATTQNNLGAALRVLGARESGTDRLEQSVIAYREALKVRTCERVPLDWAMTQNNLGNALRTLGERESSTERLEQAVAAYREALKEYTRERVPLLWAMTRNNFGNALQTLGEREGSAERVEQAIQAYHLALEELRPENAAYYHKGVLENLSRAEALLARLRQADQENE